MSLAEYRKKRNFKVTPEPKANVSSKASKEETIFVVHEHHASHLHWDVRLEMHRALKSWAVPKEPPTKKGIKRLAIEVEDHPLSYATFEGTIPEGNYGAGEVKIWDHGTYEILEQSEKAMKLQFNGKKLIGTYVLVKTNFGKKKNGWLFFKI